MRERNDELQSNCTQGAKQMRKRFVKWLVKILLPGYHIRNNPSRIHGKDGSDSTKNAPEGTFTIDAGIPSVVTLYVSEQNCLIK